MDALTEKAAAISPSSYVSIGLVGSLIGLTAWFITFKVSAEASIGQLTSDVATLRTELKELRTSLPSRDWLDLKFSNLEELVASNKKGK